MDDATREIILLHHNRIRNLQTQNMPQPSGLALLEYDLELEDVSSCWASRCEDGVTECFQTSNFPEISQTVGQLILEEDDIPDNELWMNMMDKWLVLLEELPLEMLNIYNDNRDLSEHNLAQLLSDRILFVGCAWSFLDNWIYFVCSYAPRGPIAGVEFYKIGELCTTCPDGYECSDAEPFERLCKPKTYRQVEKIRGNIQNERYDYEEPIRKTKKSKFLRMRDQTDQRDQMDLRDDDDDESAKKGKNTPVIVGASVFLVLLIFFGCFGVYAFVSSKLSANTML